MPVSGGQGEVFDFLYLSAIFKSPKVLNLYFMEGVGENTKIGTPTVGPREHGDVKARLRALRDECLNEADAVIAALKSGAYADEDALLDMEEAV